MSADQKPQKPAPPESPQKKPCKQPLAPELGSGALVQAPPALVTASPVSALVPQVALRPAAINDTYRMAAPRAPPDPIGLIVVRTTFLLV